MKIIYRHDKKSNLYFAKLEGDPSTECTGENLCYVLGNVLCVLANQGQEGVIIEHEETASEKPLEERPTRDFIILTIPNCKV